MLTKRRATQRCNRRRGNHYRSASRGHGDREFPATVNSAMKSPLKVLFPGLWGTPAGYSSNSPDSADYSSNPPDSHVRPGTQDSTANAALPRPGHTVSQPDLPRAPHVAGDQSLRDRVFSPGEVAPERMELVQHHQRSSATVAGLVFTPSAPVSNSARLAGRSAELLRLEEVVRQPGQHALVFGDRGMGKTSLVTTLSETVGGEDVVACRVTCDSSDTFASCWHKAATELSDQDYDFPARGFVTKALAEFVDGADCTPADVRRFLASLGQGDRIIVFDEFDRVRDHAQRLLFADTIKILSDRRIDATIILVGVAESADILLPEARSVERALAQFYMPRLHSRDVADLVRQRLSDARLSITDEALAIMTRLSLGLPYYAHLLGHFTVKNILDESSSVIESSHVLAAIPLILERTPRSISDAYEAIVTSSSGSLLPYVLLACALARRDSLGCFSLRDVHQSFSRLTDRTYKIYPFGHHMAILTSEDFGPILRKLGTGEFVRFRFLDPLLEPYIIMRGICGGRPEADYLLAGIRS
jgi:hypothetical protein